MTQLRETKGQTMIYKALHRTQFFVKVDQHKHHKKTGELWCSKREAMSWSTIVIVALTGR